MPTSHPITPLPSLRAVSDHRCLLSPRRRHTHAQGLKNLFEELDANADGLVSLEDLVAGLARRGEALAGEEAAALLRSMDLNGDGFIVSAGS